jgi:hypothetical protein
MSLRAADGFPATRQSPIDRRIPLNGRLLRHTCPCGRRKGKLPRNGIYPVRMFLGLRMRKIPTILVAGDLLAIAVVTVIGFATHGEADAARLPRMLTTFVPLTIGWFLLAPFLELFNPEIVSNPRQLWRPFLAMVFAGPLAALLRALLLNTVVIPIFGVVLSGSAGLGMLVWRALWCWLKRSK